MLLWSDSAQTQGLSEATGQLFSGAGNCAFCHDQWGGALTDSQGKSVSITEDWRSSMMSHSFIDPFWRATMEAEVAENPRLKSLIENKCLTCHASMARAHAVANGTEKITATAAKKSPWASEGVGCTLCHQITPAGLGTPESFSGHFTLGKDRQIFGPYQEVVTMPMQRHVDYTPVFGEHVQDSALCGSCHTLFTPVLNDDGSLAGEFPEQTPYLEWRNSVYPEMGRSCQECHLPRINESIKISARPPWIGTRDPFWVHQFAGANVFMLGLISKHAKKLEANATTEQLAAKAALTRRQLGSAVELTVAASRQDGKGLIRVDVRNRTGHKFPTGHPYRRAWLHLQVTNERGAVIFESGAVDSEGRIAGNAYQATHFEQITSASQVQVYQATMADTRKTPTWSLLRAATYLKDNRIPPRGFQCGGDPSRQIEIVGEAATDPDYQDGQGHDAIDYALGLPDSGGSYRVRVQLLYQSVPPEAVDRLLKSKGREAKAFATLYRPADKTPEVAGRAECKL